MSKIKSEETKLVENFGALGRAIRVGANSYVSLNKSGFGIKFHVPTVDLVIGIGKDHVAYLVMDRDAWAALKENQKIDITTLNNFQKQFVKPKRNVAPKKSTKPSKSKKP